MKSVRALSLALALVAAASACKKTEGKADLPPAAGEGAAPLPQLPALTVADAGAVEAAAAAGEVKTTGTLVARQEVKVAAKSSGTITAINVDDNSRVKKGDVLFRLDSRDAALMRQAGQTQLKAAQLQLKTAQREYDRIAGLVAQNAMPRQQLDQLESQVEGAKVAISAARNSIALADKMIGDATVRSPIDGVVLQKLMNVGEYASMMPPNPVVIIQDQSVLELKFKLPESALASVKQGLAVRVQIPSLGITRAATIKEVAPQVDPRTRTIELTAQLDNCDGALTPGVMAEVALGEGAGGEAITAPPTCAPAAKGKAPAARGKAAAKDGKPAKTAKAGTP